MGPPRCIKHREDSSVKPTGIQHTEWNKHGWTTATDEEADPGANHLKGSREPAKLGNVRHQWQSKYGQSVLLRETHAAGTIPSKLWGINQEDDHPSVSSREGHAAQGRAAYESSGEQEATEEVTTDCHHGGIPQRRTKISGTLYA